MTTEEKRAHDLLHKWCRLLNIHPIPQLSMPPASRMPGSLGEADKWDQWRIKVRKGLGPDLPGTIVHELLHVKTGLIDVCHDAWIDELAVLLVQLGGDE